MHVQDSVLNLEAWAVLQAVAGALDGWDTHRDHRGTTWRYTAPSGDESYVDLPLGGMVLEILIACPWAEVNEVDVSLDLNAPGADRYATPDTIADVLYGLGLPEVDL